MHPFRAVLGFGVLSFALSAQAPDKPNGNPPKAVPPAPAKNAMSRVDAQRLDRQKVQRAEDAKKAEERRLAKIEAFVEAFTATPKGTENKMREKLVGDALDAAGWNSTESLKRKINKESDGRELGGKIVEQEKEDEARSFEVAEAFTSDVKASKDRDASARARARLKRMEADFASQDRDYENVTSPQPRLNPNPELGRTAVRPTTKVSPARASSPNQPTSYESPTYGLDKPAPAKAPAPCKAHGRAPCPDCGQR